MLFLDGGSTSIRHLLSPSSQTLLPPFDRLWTAAYCLTQPSAVLEWHKSFLAAGSNIITTNTYQLPCQDQLPDVPIANAVSSAVTLALRAVNEFGSGAVALSFGTRNATTGVTGGEYVTEAKSTIAEYESYHRQKISEFRVATGDSWDKVEYLAFETLSSYEEAEAILNVLTEDEIVWQVRGKKPWITFCCVDGSVDRMEGIIQRLVKRPELSSLWGIGFNCVGIHAAIALARMLAGEIEGRDLTLVLYPDGEPRLGVPFKQSTMTDLDIQRWAESLKRLDVFNDGRLLLGGCCRTDTRFIAALAYRA
jgi:homocysteine S-methyltransferase